MRTLLQGVPEGNSKGRVKPNQLTWQMRESKETRRSELHGENKDNGVYFSTIKQLCTMGWLSLNLERKGDLRNCRNYFQDFKQTRRCPSFDFNRTNIEHSRTITKI